MAVKVDLSTVVIVSAVVGACAFAAGRATSSAVAASAPAAATPVVANPKASGELPAGHPSIGGGPAKQVAAELAWTKPARWEEIPSESRMRLATYRIPRAPGDAEDAELSVMQAGGSIEANIDRWAGQFGDEGKASLKRRNERIAALDVTVVELDGTYAGGMGKDAHALPNATLLGAIVATPGGAHFFKMTGPSKTVKAARAELNELVASLTLR